MKTKSAHSFITIALGLGVGLTLALLWMARTDVTGDPASIARAADPSRANLTE